MRTFVAALLTLVCLSAFAPVTQYKIGDTVNNFTLANANGNGKMVSLDDYKNAKGVIVIFTCNHCPFAKMYQSRVNDLNKKYMSKGYPVIAISPNDVEAVPEDNFEEMGKRAKEQGYTYPYLLDGTQDIARAFNAVKTPHAFLLQNEKGRWILRYAGAIDDNGSEPEKATHHYVEEAISDLNAGRAVQVATTKSVGCGIKWKGGKG